MVLHSEKGAIISVAKSFFYQIVGAFWESKIDEKSCFVITSIFYKKNSSDGGTLTPPNPDADM